MATSDDADSGAAPVSVRSAWSALVLAGLLFVVDGIIFNQGVIAALVGLGLILVGLPRTFLAKKYRNVRPQRLRNLAIYMAAVVLVLVFNWLNNRLARSRAEQLIVAVEAFHAKNARYPARLSELVPEYIDRVPVAKYVLSGNFFYSSGGGKDPFLFYVDVPPFGRPTYSFARKEWSYLD